MRLIRTDDVNRVLFDHFWNSEWVVSADNIETGHDDEFAQDRWREIQQKNRVVEELNTFGVEPEDWSDELASTPVLNSMNFAPTPQSSSLSMCQQSRASSSVYTGRQWRWTGKWSLSVP